MATGIGTRRWLLGTAAAGGVLAAACATGQQGGGSTSGAEATKLAVPQSVEFWGPDPAAAPPTGPAMAAVVNAFKARYSALNVVVAGGSLGISPASQEKFIGAIAAGTPPDVTYTDRYIPRSYAVLEAYLPLDDRIRTSKVKPDEWWPYLRRDVTQGGKTYGLPTHTDARLFGSYPAVDPKVFKDQVIAGTIDLGRRSRELAKSRNSICNAA